MLPTHHDNYLLLLLWQPIVNLLVIFTYSSKCFSYLKLILLYLFVLRVCAWSKEIKCYKSNKKCSWNLKKPKKVKSIDFWWKKLLYWFCSFAFQLKLQCHELLFLQKLWKCLKFNCFQWKLELSDNYCFKNYWEFQPMKYSKKKQSLWLSKERTKRITEGCNFFERNLNNQDLKKKMKTEQIF